MRILSKPVIYCILVICLLVFVYESWATDGYIQSNACHTAGPSTNCAFGSNVTAGNTIIVSCDGEGGTLVTSTDTKSNTYSAPTGAARTCNGGAIHYNVYMAQNVVSGATTVTCTANGASGIQAVIAEYASSTTAGAFDVSSSSNPTSANITQTTSRSATTSVANEMMYETCINYNSAITSPNGTSRQNFSFDHFQMIQDSVVVNAQVYASSFTTTTGNAWGCLEMAIKPTAAATGLACQSEKFLGVGCYR